MNFHSALVRKDPLSAVRRAQAAGRGVLIYMPDNRSNASWSDAAAQSAALWVFVIFSFLPLMLQRHEGDWASVILDYTTVIAAFGLSMGLFALFRATLNWALVQRGLVLLAAVFAAATAQTILDRMFSVWIAEGVNQAWRDIPQSIHRSYSATFNYICIFGFNIALFHFSYGRRRAIAHERQLSETRSEAQQAKLRALRYQLNPHFLFNTLNSISSLIVTRRNDDAEEMTDRLASFLRASLTFEPTELVPLEEELALVEDYLDIESVRFGDRLQVEIECAPEAGERLVPPFIIQPLVENAVKHGVAQARTAIAVSVTGRVEGDDLWVEVANGRDRDASESTGGTGVGLGNVRRRLEAVFGSSAELVIEDEPERFVAAIRIARPQQAVLTAG